MAPCVKDLKRTSLLSGTSSSTHRSRTGGNGRNIAKSSKKPQRDAKHADPLGLDLNTHPEQATTSKKRQRSWAHKDGLVMKRHKRWHRNASTKTPAASSTVPDVAPTVQRLISLPTELQHKIISYVSARDAARLCRVCKSLKKLVTDSTKHLAKVYVDRGLSRLQELVNEFNDLKAPTDAESLVRAVRVWAKRRGIFSHRHVSMGSMLKLMTHFYMKNVRDDGDADSDDADSDNADSDDADSDHADSGDAGSKDYAMSATNRAFAAVEFAHLLTQPLGESEIKIQLERLKKTGVLNKAELAKLLNYAAETRAQTWSPRLSGRIWPQGTMEYMTFNGAWTLTPLFQLPSTSGIEFFGSVKGDCPFNSGSFDLWAQYLEAQDVPNQHLPPGLGSESVVRYLGLPKLPNAVSCYYVQDAWAREQIDKLTRRFENAAKRRKPTVKSASQPPLSPLLKAAMLEGIRYL